MRIKGGKSFSRILLTALVVGGVVLVASTNPYFGIKAIGAIQKELKRRKWRQFRDDLYYLKRKGFVDVEQNPDGTYTVRTTKDGQKQALKYGLDNLSIEIPKQWDGFWRLAIFDIPIQKERGRHALLAKFKELGFIMVQRSIWAYPFECKKELAILAKAFEIEGCVQYLVCREVSMGQYLCREFERRNRVKLTKIG